MPCLKALVHILFFCGYTNRSVLLLGVPRFWAQARGTYQPDRRIRKQGDRSGKSQDLKLDLAKSWGQKHSNQAVRYSALMQRRQKSRETTAGEQPTEARSTDHEHGLQIATAEADPSLRRRNQTRLFPSSGKATRL